MSSLVKQLDLAVTWGPMLVTVLFLALFIATLFWIYRPGSRHYYERQSLLPLEDGAAAPQPPAMEKRNG
jgi:cbb3-type cytochrome oxidase subunit 3